MAVQMALGVGLSNDKFCLSSQSEHDRHMLQATWASVSQLNTTANSSKYTNDGEFSASQTLTARYV